MIHLPPIAKVEGKGSISAAEMLLNKQLGAHLARDEQNVPLEMKKDVLDALDIKYEVATLFYKLRGLV